jgi:hypothetical protein
VGLREDHQRRHGALSQIENARHNLLEGIKGWGHVNSPHDLSLEQCVGKFAEAAGIPLQLLNDILYESANIDKATFEVFMQILGYSMNKAWKYMGILKQNTYLIKGGSTEEKGPFHAVEDGGYFYIDDENLKIRKGDTLVQILSDGERDEYDVVEPSERQIGVPVGERPRYQTRVLPKLKETEKEKTAAPVTIGNLNISGDGNTQIIAAGGSNVTANISKYAKGLDEIREYIEDYKDKIADFNGAVAILESMKEEKEIGPSFFRKMLDFIGKVTVEKMTSGLVACILRKLGP